MKDRMVSIIIVNWNGLKWLSDCFTSLYAQNYRNFEIIFVDNASIDGSVAWVRKHYPRTKIIINSTNLGFAGGNNVGYRKAVGRYVLFINNDTRVTNRFISELVHVVESDPEIAGVQSKILLMDKPDTYDSVGAFLTPTGFLYHYGFGKKDEAKYDRQIPLYTAKGACMLFRKSVLDRISMNGNIFDPDYFAYFEETDMCHRVWLAGYRIVYAYRSVIYHKMGATSSQMDNSFIQYHSFKNRIATYLKNLDIFHIAVIIPVHLVFAEVFAFVSLCKRKYQLFFAVQKSIGWNISHLPHILSQRHYVQTKIRKVPDRTFWHEIFKQPSYRYYLNVSKGAMFYDED